MGLESLPPGDQRDTGKGYLQSLVATVQDTAQEGAAAPQPVYWVHNAFLAQGTTQTAPAALH